jgi:hypothetical protein
MVLCACWTSSSDSSLAGVDLILGWLLHGWMLRGWIQHRSPSSMAGVTYIAVDSTGYGSCMAAGWKAWHAWHGVRSGIRTELCSGGVE